MASDISVSPKLDNETLVKDATQRVEPEWAALGADELIQVNLDVYSAVKTVLGLLPEVRGFRERFAKELPTFDLDSFDKLEDYALALHSTNAAYLSATRPADDLQELTTAAILLRNQLEHVAKALSSFGLVDSAKVAQLNSTNGHQALAEDLEILSQVLSHGWEAIQGKSPITRESLETASRLSIRLMRIVGLREQAPAVVAAASERRTRAFTKLIKTYEAARRAVFFLRGELDDADDIAPSLYQGRPRRRPADEADVPTTGSSEEGTRSGVSSPALPPPLVTASSADADPSKTNPFLHDKE